MPATLSPADPNLQAAVGRLRRTQWAWAALLAALAALALASAPSGVHPLSALPWAAAAVLLALGPQPALLALVALLWALSLAALTPAARAALGPDPLGLIFGGGGIELVALAGVRLLLAVAAWNQFLFYRMLYGTAQASGLDPALPIVPEVVRNRSDSLALASMALGGLGLLSAWVGAAMLPASASAGARALGAGAAAFALGLGMGAAFSPTRRRGAALAGAGLGALAFLSAFIAPGA